MNAIRILVVAIVVLLGLSGCAAPMPYMGSGGYAGGGYNQYSRPVSQPHSAHRQVVYGAYAGPDGRFVVDTRTPLSAYAFNAGAAPGMYPAFQEPDGRWNIAGFTQSNPPDLAGGVPNQRAYGGTPMVNPAMLSQYGTASGVAPTLGGGMSPEAAARELAEHESRPNPCTSQESTLRTAIGTVIGVAAGAAITSGHNRGKGAVVGGLAGAAFGNGGASAGCQRYTDARLALQAGIDAAKPRCRDELHQREVDGRLMTDKTRDCGATEAKDFDRIGQGQPTAKSQPMRMQRPPEDFPPK